MWLSSFFNTGAPVFIGTQTCRCSESSVLVSQQNASVCGSFIVHIVMEVVAVYGIWFPVSLNFIPRLQNQNETGTTLHQEARRRKPRPQLTALLGEKQMWCPPQNTKKYTKHLLSEKKKQFLKAWSY